MNTLQVTHSFGPVIDANSRILILGSFPSVRSRLDSFYYMHPANRFWSLLSILFQDDFETAPIQERIRLLCAHHLALYDVIESCEIVGSADSSIKNVVPADLDSLIKQSQIQRIYLNGKTAYRLFCRYFPQLMSLALVLPSTSPANAACRMPDLVAAWKVLLSES